MKIALTNILIVLSMIQMPAQNKSQELKKATTMKNTTTLLKANEEVRNGNYEEYLNYLTEDTKWVFVGDQTLLGKEAVRQYIATYYLAPPIFDMEKAIEEGNYVTAMGSISLKNKQGSYDEYSYCDVWRFENGKIAELKAFVIAKKQESGAK